MKRSSQKQTTESSLFGKLPSVDELLRSEAGRRLIAAYGHTAMANTARDVLRDLRADVANMKHEGDSLSAAISDLPSQIKTSLERDFACTLRPVINATGVVLHTNLGRAPLSAEAIAHIAETAGSYSNLEMDLDSGDRGRRDVHAQRLFRSLFAREHLDRDIPTETIVVNNGAAAVILALNTLAEGGEVIVSRGELVEIGGSFRLPEIMRKSGARLREVGTTNRTRIADYEEAIGEHTRLLMRAHRSNFAIVGFTEQPKIGELAALGRKHKMPVFEDLGNGAVLDLSEMGIPGERRVQDSLHDDVDVVGYSGDKLLGGPQCGMLTGRPELIARMRANPLFRALRAGKLVYAALEATLLAYLKGRAETIPAIAMLRVPASEIEARAERLRAALASSKDLTVDLAPGESLAGGGTAPARTVGTFLLAIRCTGKSANSFASQLRTRETPIVARVEDHRVLVDLRTVMPHQERALLEGLVEAASAGEA